MPWCPQCKQEYQEGYTTCKDCKIDLVENLEEAAVEFVPFFQADDEKIARKLASFFEYSGLPSEVSYDEEYELYNVSIPPEMEKDARKLYEAFYFVEAERVMNEKGKKKPETEEDAEELTEEAAEVSDGEAPEADATADAEEDASLEEDYSDEIPSDDISVSGVQRSENSVYVMKYDQYKDLTGTVWIFAFFGIAGIIFVILNLTKIITFLNGWLPNLVMGALFLFFIIVAITTGRKAKRVRSEIDAENILTRDINNWLKANVTEEFLASVHNDNISDEANYIRSTDYIKELLVKEFGSQNLAYLDRLIDDYYTNTFDKEEEE